MYRAMNFDNSIFQLFLRPAIHYKKASSKLQGQAKILARASRAMIHEIDLVDKTSSRIPEPVFFTYLALKRTTRSALLKNPKFYQLLQKCWRYLSITFILFIMFGNLTLVNFQAEDDTIRKTLNRSLRKILIKYVCHEKLNKLGN